MEVRDPVHGLIHYDSLEERVINSRALQRLRGVHQLAMAYLVYPGALHTRFDHSLGVMHVAGQMARSLNAGYGRALLSDDEIRTIRLAALLHDVGHGPFSHVSETPLAVMSQDQQPSGSGLEKLHERITADIIALDPELRSILGEGRLEVAGLIRPSQTPSLAQSIVSGPLDADKLDYLLRDSYFCGVKYGVYDLGRVLETLRVVRDPGSGSFLGTAEEGVPAVEQHLVARYQMTRQVYRHRIRRSTDELLVRAITTAAQSCAQLARLYTYGDDCEGFCETWLRYDDRAVLDTIRAECGKTDASGLVDRLLARRLPLHVLEMDLKALPNKFLQGKLAKADRRTELEGRIAARLRSRPCEVIVDLVQTDLPRPSSAEPGIDPERIYVESEGEISTFGEVSDLFRENPLSVRRTVVVFVPFEAAEKQERGEERGRLAEQVREVIKDWGEEA